MQRCLGKICGMLDALYTPSFRHLMYVVFVIVAVVVILIYDCN